MNFGDAYSVIKTKLLKEKNKEGLKTLVRKIQESPVLTKQFLIYNNLQEAKKNKNSDFVFVLENFCVNTVSPTKEINSLLKYFNIDKQAVKTTAVNESIHKFICYNAGIPSDIKKINESYQVINNWVKEGVVKKSTDSFSPKTLFKTKLNESSALYGELNESEQRVVQVLYTEDQNWVNNKIQIIEKYSKFLSPQDKILTEECVKNIKEEKIFETKVLSTNSLFENTKKLMEGQFGGPGKIKLPDSQFIKTIVLSTDDDSKNPEFVVADISIPIKLLSTKFQDKKDEAEEVVKDVKNILRKSVFTSVNTKYKNIIDPTGIISDTSDNRFLVINKKGRALTIKSSIFFNCKRPTEGERDISEYSKSISGILKDLSLALRKDLPQLDPAVQTQNNKELQSA